MTSFALVAEPLPQPRLAALLLLLHAAAAALPWVAHCPWPVAAAATGIAVLGYGASLGRVPGAHGRLRAVALAAGECRVRLAGAGDWVPATLAPASRAWPGIVLLEVQAGRRRHRWLLPRASLPRHTMRRLKALIRLA